MDAKRKHLPSVDDAQLAETRDSALPRAPLSSRTSRAAAAEAVERSVERIAREVASWGPGEDVKEFVLNAAAANAVLWPLKHRLGARYLVVAGFSGVVVKRRWSR